LISPTLLKKKRRNLAKREEGRRFARFWKIGPSRVLCGKVIVEIDGDN
jgi:hypothetical protein